MQGNPHGFNSPAGPAYEILLFFVAVELHKIQMKLVYKRDNLAALSVHKYANAEDMRGKDRTNLPSDRVRDETRARRIKIQTNEVSATLDRQLCVSNTRNSADFNADAHPAPPSIVRRGTPG